MIVLIFILIINLLRDHYKSYPSLKFILSYKNILIKEDESSIEEIPEGSEINIIEERPIPNTCFYDSFINKYGNNDMRNIFFLDSFGNKKILNFPGEATLSDAKISFYNKYGLNEEMSILLYNGLKLENNDEKKIRTNTYINVYDPNQIYKRKEFGKTLVGNVMIHNFEQKKLLKILKL